MRIHAILALLAGALLAGCNSPSDTPSETGPTFDDLGLEATSSTGVIRGVVVDDAIRPIPGARVVLQGDAPMETVSTDLGTFGFEALAPGTYFLTVSKLGYSNAQQSADVVAGLAEPDIVKVQLMVDAASRPYVETYVFDGFTECSTVVFGFCGFANDMSSTAGAGNLTQDNTQVRYQVTKVPTWVQSEMVWSSTQALGGDMALMYSWDEGTCDDPLGAYCDHDVEGSSPLLLTANAEQIAEIGLADTTDELYIRTFTAAMEGSIVAGATIEQRFTIYTHVFYGYQPTEGWRFSSGEPVPQPTA